MTNRKRSATAFLAIAALLAFAAPSSELTLLVNGATPSIRYQRIADRIAQRMPVPDETVALYLHACPDSGDGYAAWSTRAMICLDPSRLRDPSNLVNAEAHEIGHLEIESTFNDTDRARFAYDIWRRPRIGWRDQIASCAPGSIGYDPARGKSCGDHSEAFEWAADAYRVCATGEWREGDMEAWLGLLPDRGYRGAGRTSDLRAARAPVAASCGLIREAAIRARPAGR